MYIIQIPSYYFICTKTFISTTFPSSLIFNSKLFCVIQDILTTISNLCSIFLQIIIKNILLYHSDNKYIIKFVINTLKFLTYLSEGIITKNVNVNHIPIFYT